jgi:hypothetical protein
LCSAFSALLVQSSGSRLLFPFPLLTACFFPLPLSLLRWVVPRVHYAGTECALATLTAPLTTRPERPSPSIARSAPIPPSGVRFPHHLVRLHPLLGGPWHPPPGLRPPCLPNCLMFPLGWHRQERLCLRSARRCPRAPRPLWVWIPLLFLLLQCLAMSPLSYPPSHLVHPRMDGSAGGFGYPLSLLVSLFPLIFSRFWARQSKQW